MAAAAKPNGPPTHLRLEQEQTTPGATPLSKLGDCQLPAPQQAEQCADSPSQSSDDTSATFHSAQQDLPSNSDATSNHPKSPEGIDAPPQSDYPHTIKSYLYQVSYAADDDPFSEIRRPVRTTNLSDARQQLIEACVDYVFNSLPTHLLRLVDTTIVTRNEIWDGERSRIENILDEELGELRYEYSKGLGWHWTGFLERSWCEVSARNTPLFESMFVQTPWIRRNMPKTFSNSPSFHIDGAIMSRYFTKCPLRTVRDPLQAVQGMISYATSVKRRRRTLIVAMSGQTRAASTRRAVQSSRKRSAPCTAGTVLPTSALFTSGNH